MSMLSFGSDVNPSVNSQIGESQQRPTASILRTVKVVLCRDTAFQFAEYFGGAELVSGHDFSRAKKRTKN